MNVEEAIDVALQIANALAAAHAAGIQLYLQGRYYWAKNTQESNRQSGEYFQKAIAIDPKYALAWAGLADYYTDLTATGFFSWKRRLA